MAKYLVLLVLGSMLACISFAGAQVVLADPSRSSVGDAVVPTSEMSNLQSLVTPVAQTQSACAYTSYMGIWWGCWSPDSNPLAYYYVQTYRWGDPMTWDHFTWRRDYKGNGVACPLNERPGSPYNIPICGWPE